MPQYIYYQWKQYPVPIQYSLPKWINSVEAGLLIDWSIEDEDLLSIFYEWDKKWIIKIEKQWRYLNIMKIKALPDDAKKYEKYIYDNFFSSEKFNLLEARLLVMDYCFQKWWIQDYIPLVQKIFNKMIRFALLWYFFLSIICVILFVIVCITILLIKWEISHDGAINITNIIEWYIFLKILVATFISRRICINRIKKLHVSATTLWAEVVAELLWYKKYLNKTIHDNNDDDMKEDFLMKYGLADHNVALKIDTPFHTIRGLKKYTYNSIKFLPTYLEMHKN